MCVCVTFVVVVYADCICEKGNTPTNECSGYDNKQSVSEASVLEFGGL